MRWLNNQTISLKEVVKCRFSPTPLGWLRLVPAGDRGWNTRVLEISSANGGSAASRWLYYAHIKRVQGSLRNNNYSTPDPPRELWQRLFSPFLPGSHTSTSMNQKGPESPGHVTESAHRASPHLARPHETEITGALRAEEHQAGADLCWGNIPTLPSSHSSFKENSYLEMMESEAQGPGCKATWVGHVRPVVHIWGLWEATVRGCPRRSLGSTGHYFPQQRMLVTSPSRHSGCCSEWLPSQSVSRLISSLIGWWLS